MSLYWQVGILFNSLASYLTINSIKNHVQVQSLRVSTGARELKTGLKFQAKIISSQPEWHIPLHSMALASFWGQKYIDSWDLTSEAVLRSSEATFQSVLKWFWFHFHTVLMSKWPKKGLHELSIGLTSEAEMEAAEAGLSKSLDFKAYA